MGKITSVVPFEVLDSRGIPTLCVKVRTDLGGEGLAMVPSGSSCGVHEVVEFRDGDPRRFFGKGLLGALSLIKREISEVVLGWDVFDQAGIDGAIHFLDGSGCFCRIGGNTALACSLAVLKAAASELGLQLYEYIGGRECCTLPLPIMNLINGGMHADGGLSFQELLIYPHGAESFSEAVRWGSEVFHSLRGVVSRMGGSTLVGDEGGVVPNVNNTASALEVLVESIECAGFSPGKDIFIGIDCAASTLLSNGLYKVDGDSFDSDGMVGFLTSLVDKYPIRLIEDGMGEDDWDGWSKLTEKLGDRVSLVGDDLFVTNCDRLKLGVESRVANCVLIKPNQVGSVTQMVDTVKFARGAGYEVIASHRSGETEDVFISDVAVGIRASMVKAGAPCRSDRTSKYNRLTMIESESNLELCANRV